MSASPTLNTAPSMLEHNMLNAAILMFADTGPQEGSNSWGRVPDGLDSRALQPSDSARSSMTRDVFGSAIGHVGFCSPFLAANFMAALALPMRSTQLRKHMH